MEQKNITVVLKLYSYIEKELNIPQYDPGRGMHLTLSQGKRLKDLIKKAGLQSGSDYIFFRNTEQIGLRSKLFDGDVISCLKPSGGG